MKKHLLTCIVALCLIISGCFVFASCKSNSQPTATSLDVFFLTDKVKESGEYSVDITGRALKDHLFVRCNFSDGTYTSLTVKTEDTDGYTVATDIPEVVEERQIGKQYTYAITYKDFPTVTLKITFTAHQLDVPATVKTVKGYRWDAIEFADGYKYQITSALGQTDPNGWIEASKREVELNEGEYLYVYAYSNNSKFQQSQASVVGPFEKPQELTIPTVANTDLKFMGEKEYQTLQLSDFNDNLMTIDKPELMSKGIDFGEVQFTISLKDKFNYVWANGKTDDITLTFKVGKKEIEVPRLEQTSFVYDGERKQAKFLTEFDYTTLEVDSDLCEFFGTEAGTYSIRVYLLDPERTKFIDTDETSVVLTWQIVTSTVEKPTFKPVDLVFTYNTTYRAGQYVNGFTQGIRYVCNVPNTDLNWTDITFGKYVFTFYPEDGYTWTDGTTDGVVFNFEVKKREIPVPVLSGESEFNYSKYNTRELTISNPARYYASQVEGFKNEKRTDAGTYLVKYQRVYPQYTYWADPDAEDIIVFTLKINKATMNANSLQTRLNNQSNSIRFTLDGDGNPVLKQMPDIFSNEILEIDTPDLITVGRIGGAHTFNVTIINDNYMWSDGTTGSKQFTWTINKTTVKRVSISGTSSYTWTGKTYTVGLSSAYEDYKSYLQIDEGSEMSASEVGEHKIYVSLKYPEYCSWLDDGTNETITLTWTIKEPASTTASTLADQSALQVVNVANITYVQGDEEKQQCLPEALKSKKCGK